MKCIKYEVVAKKTGKVVLSNIAWIDKNTDTNEWIKKNFNTKLVNVVIK